MPIEEAICLFKVIGMPMTTLNAVMLKQCAALIRDLSFDGGIALPVLLQDFRQEYDMTAYALSI